MQNAKNPIEVLHVFIIFYKYKKRQYTPQYITAFYYFFTLFYHLYPHHPASHCCRVGDFYLDGGGHFSRDHGRAGC